MPAVVTDVITAGISMKKEDDMSENMNSVKNNRRPENSRERIAADTALVRRRLETFLDDESVHSWLHGDNAFLNGAKPVDVIRYRGTEEVLDAADQEEAGALL